MYDYNAVNELTVDLNPQHLGLPSKFNRFRLPQKQAIEWLYEDCDKQISAACLPTGAGKTAIAVALKKILGVKAVYLVATKALQQQVHSDFRSIGMVDVRGRANYSCPNYGNCEAGYDEECSLHQTNACQYSCAVERAKDADLIVTNYAYWMHARQYNPKALERDGRPVELLICDEAHALENQLSGFATVKIYASEITRSGTRKTHTSLRGPFPIQGLMNEEADAVSWRIWARNVISEMGSPADENEEDFSDRCIAISRMGPNWVWQFDERGHCAFTPIHLSGFTRSLFSSVPRVLLMSASLNEFTLKLLLPSDCEYDYRAWGQVFNPANAPVYHIPTRKLNWKSTDEDYKAIVDTADAIVNQRSDRKGIIHTVSYARSERALQYSRHTQRFIWNKDSGGLQDCLAKFRGGAVGSILVTPSVEAGFNFPGRQAEYQIILKFPFPNETVRVIKERCNRIPGYRLNYAAQETIQMAGRIRRYEEDRGETFILDNAVRQLCGAEGRSYCPPGFRIFTVTQVPPAPPRVTDQITIQ